MCQVSRRRHNGGVDAYGHERMTSEDDTKVRAMVARCTFWGSNRPDLHNFAAEEAPRCLAASQAGDMQKRTADREALEP